LTPRLFTELLADSLLLLKESVAEWTLIVSGALVPGIAVTAAALVVLGLTDMTMLQSAIAQGEPQVILPLLVVGFFSKACGALGFVALIRAAAARDEGRALGVKRAFAEALPRLIPFIVGQLRALLSILWGLVRLIVPGLKLCVRYTFVPLAVIVDDRRGGEALSRSASVAEADPSKTLWNMLGAAGLASVVYAVLSFVVTAALTFPTSAAATGQTLPEAMLMGFVHELLSGLIFGWMSAFMILLYRDLAPAAR